MDVIFFLDDPMGTLFLLKGREVGLHLNFKIIVTF